MIGVDIINEAISDIKAEYSSAKAVYPYNFNSQHEAIAVIREEYLELEVEVFKNQKKYDIEAQRKEAIQLAAMCLRFITELTEKN